MNNPKILKRIFLFLSGVITLWSFTGSSYAATTTGTFTVSSTVTATCSVSAGNLAFGSYTGAQVDATSTITVTCTNGSPYKIGLDAGTGSGATVSTRKMTSGGNTLNYSLYSDAGRTTNWGNTVGVDTLDTGTGSGSAQNVTVYGRIPASQLSPAGSYSDTITVTITF
jgi:spore coat protein U-like protein